ncbi:cold-shock protein [Paenibacillus sp. VMFN-D1]|uniref:cold-shock protein n=1 Tax=Paenibacillus sp. VMFN-D1 TaxID=2135608 RepID=UPI000E245364|nr:cold shock domain-containing protein [Paenibacillus sp. VMFN-D1]RED32420.1 cold shock CspA family protein [Paenibacillus sp. VMFN-D1]
MFVEGQVWRGNPEENMQEVYDRVVPTPYQSPRESRLEAAAGKLGEGIGKAIKEATREIIRGELTGTINSPIRERGFGFITPDDGGSDVYFHAEKNPNAEGLRRGDRVAFDLERNIRIGRTYAVNMSVIGGKGEWRTI